MVKALIFNFEGLFLFAYLLDKISMLEIDLQMHKKSYMYSICSYSLAIWCSVFILEPPFAQLLRRDHITDIRQHVSSLRYTVSICIYGYSCHPHS